MCVIQLRHLRVRSRYLVKAYDVYMLAPSQTPKLRSNLIPPVSDTYSSGPRADSGLAARLSSEDLSKATKESLPLVVRLNATKSPPRDRWVSTSMVCHGAVCKIGDK